MQKLLRAMAPHSKCLAIAIFLLAVMISSTQAGENFGVLLASYNTWYNYAFQADVAHLYHVMREGGIPDKNIITMVYDDIADNPQNPFKGKVFNSYDMKDVYKGSAKDYTGKDVNKDVFLAVLKGDKDAIKKLTGRDGKVLESGPDDNVFVLLNDHGGPGFVCFWDQKDLKALELNDTIAYMHANNKYKKMMLVVDTCHAGSMFENVLPSDIGVYAMTASNAHQSGYMSECFSEYFGQNHTCFGSLFCINWIYELQSTDRKQESLQQMFDEANTACKNMSNPMQYGDLSIAKEAQSTFFGDSSKKHGDASRRFSFAIGQRERHRRSAPSGDSIPKHLVIYYTLVHKLSTLPSNSAQYRQTSQQIRHIESMMNQVDELMKDIPVRAYSALQQRRPVSDTATGFGVINWPCYNPALQTFRAECPGVMQREEIKYYAFSQFGILINLCSNVLRPTQILEAIKGAARNSSVCQV